MGIPFFSSAQVFGWAIGSGYHHSTHLEKHLHRESEPRPITVNKNVPPTAGLSFSNVSTVELSQEK